MKKIIKKLLLFSLVLCSFLLSFLLNYTFKPASLSITISKTNSSWLQQVQKNIKESEYEITWDKEIGTYQSPNRANNLRFYYYNDGFRAKPRVEKLPLFDCSDMTLSEKEKKYKDIEQWVVNQKVVSVHKEAIPHIFSGKELIVKNNKAYIEDEVMSIEYENNEAGMRQNFIVKQRPCGDKKLQIDLMFETELECRVFDNAIVFVNSNGEEKMKYHSLKVWDADGKILASQFIPRDDEGCAAIVVDDLGAQYPITIDPLSTAVNWIAESNQVEAYFGSSVSTAGDVNGDGYSDVIVGAPFFDAGQTNEGRAFVYHGSASGLSSSPNWIAESNQVDAYFGTSVSTAGDVNGDEYSDVIIGASYFDGGQTNEGRAYVYHGSASGLSSSSNWTAESNQIEALFGYSVSTAGDVNSDGYSDVIVGAFLFDNGQTDEGAAFVYHGSASGLSSSANWMGESNQANAYFGRFVSMAGDVNGDGYKDVIIGSPDFDAGQADEGRVFVFHGSAAGLSTSANWTSESNQEYAFFGHCVSTAGDVNGDGYSDVIIGAPRFDAGEINEGRAFIYHGSATGLSTTANWIAEGNQHHALYGFSVSLAGDINGDGFCDVIVGAYMFDAGQTDEGSVYVYHGSGAGISTTANWITESNQSDAYFGYSVSTAGDVNGDGYSDVIIGAPYFDAGQTDEGRTFVYHGSAGELSAIANWTAESNQGEARFGISVSTAGDVNGDGFSDVIIGAPFFDGGETNEGRAFVYHGSAAGLSSTANWTAESNQAGACFGFSVSTAGDINGDGYSDVVIGAPLFDNNETDEGRAYVYHGSYFGLSPSPNWFSESDQVEAYFGTSVATAGDVNSDGYSDVIIAAPSYDAGEINEGRVFVYYGWLGGLPPNPDWTMESDQANAYFGQSVSTAGDVNGDSFSDVIIGSPEYDSGETDEGRTFVFHGSYFGLSQSANWTAESNQEYANFGFSVSTAGDVNGDGFSDVIVGAHRFDYGQTDEGVVFGYSGSVRGLSIYPSWAAESNQVSALFGNSVSSAGDVNGDGYSDVIIGAPNFNGGQTDEGRVFVYHGSASGPTVKWTAESNQFYAYFGHSVSSAGDINGDGYSDVIVGSPSFDAGQTDEGRAFAYFGNEVDGMDLRPRQWRPNFLTQVIAPLKTRSQNQAGLSLFGRTFFGRSKAKIQFEVKPLRTPFNGLDLIETTTWNDVGTSGVQINQLISNLSDRTMYKWRARVKFRMSDGAPQQYNRWVYANNNGGLGESDFQVSDDDQPLPIQLLYFTAQISENGNGVLLEWTTLSEVNNYGFFVERRAENEPTFTELPNSFIPGAGTTIEPQSYSFVDRSLPNYGTFHYRLRQVDNNGLEHYSQPISINYSALSVKEEEILEYQLHQNYPNPFNPTTTITFSIPVSTHCELKVFNLLGQEVATLVNEWKETGSYTVSWDAQTQSSGVYLYQLQAGQFKETKKLVKIK